LFAVDIFGTVLTVFCPIGLRQENLTADSAPLGIAAMEDFRFKRLVLRQHAPPKPLAIDRVGYDLHTDTFFTIV
jgi:hypothetical protein